LNFANMNVHLSFSTKREDEGGLINCLNYHKMKVVEAQTSTSGMVATKAEAKVGDQKQLKSENAPDRNIKKGF
jgi:hypothetical protein